MGRQASSKRKTNFAKIFSLVEDSLKRHKSLSIDKAIFKFFKGFTSLKDLNRCLTEGYSESVHQRYLLRVLYLKVILPLETLRSVHLVPPAGVEADQWVCFANPCSSSDRYRCQNSKVLQKLRSSLGQVDNLKSDFYDSFEKTWGDYSRTNAADFSKKSNLGPFSPLLLFPVKDLPGVVKKEIESLSGVTSEIIDKLFICPDHFGPAKGVTLEPSLRSDTVFNYSLEYLQEVLENGKGVFRLGRKGWRNLPFLPVLASKLAGKPSFTSPLPVDDILFQALTATLRASNMSGFIQTPQFSGGDQER